MMLLQWLETTEAGEIVTKNSLGVNVENAHTYAKRNCRQCNGRGLESWDNGWVYFQNTDENGYTNVVKTHNNPRIVACGCVLRTLNKTGL